MNILVNKISEESLKLGARYFAYRIGPRCGWTGQLLCIFRKFLTELVPFFGQTFFYLTLGS